MGFRPYVQVSIEINNQHLTLNAIIDSGAQDTLINLDFASLFNVDLKESDGFIKGVGEMGGVSYDTNGTITFVQMDNIRIASPISFASFGADMLLGQNSFFKNFNILFQGREGIFKLIKVKNYKDEQ